jgi:hypothetical protein
MKTLRRGLRGLFAAFAIVSALSPTQALTDPPAAAAIAGDAAGAVASTMVPTNLPGVYAFPQPPRGFDPDHATPSELARYGYPPRPDDPNALAPWRMATKPGLERVVPALLPTNRYHLPMAAVAAEAPRDTTGSLNWSGYALRGDPGSAAFYSVLGHWTIPTAQQQFGTCSDSLDYSGQWVGIDGFGNEHLLQSGSEADAYCEGGRQIGEYYPFLEWLPGPEYEIYRPHERLPFDPGDYLMVQVWATSWVNGTSRTGHLLFTDLTQNWQTSLSFPAARLGGTNIVGRSAEWIVERPLVGDKFARLANYTANPWTVVFADDLSRGVHTPAAPGAASSYNITMVDDSGAAISSVTLYGNSALWFYNEGTSR